MAILAFLAVIAAVVVIFKLFKAAALSPDALVLACLALYLLHGSSFSFTDTFGLNTKNNGEFFFLFSVLIFAAIWAVYVYCMCQLMVAAPRVGLAINALALQAGSIISTYYIYTEFFKDHQFFISERANIAFAVVVGIIGGLITLALRIDRARAWGLAIDVPQLHKQHKAQASPPINELPLTPDENTPGESYPRLTRTEDFDNKRGA